MATLTLVDTPPKDDETLSEAIVRRLLGEFGQRRLSMASAAKRVGMSQTSFSRRMTLNQAFDVAEIEHLCAVLDLDRDYILTGARTLPPRDGNRSLLPRVDSNHEPAGEYPDVELAAKTAA